MIYANFLTTTDDNRKVSKNYTVNFSNVACDIYDSCDLYNPTLIVKSNNVISSNYLYIPNFNRYYFIVNFFGSFVSIFCFGTITVRIPSLYSAVASSAFIG